jgi:hypothetical protein
MSTNSQYWKVIVKGLSPYMQHRMDDVKLGEWERNRGQIMEREDVNHEDIVRAEYHSYYNKETGEYYIPKEHFKGALIDASKAMKAKVGGATKSMKMVVAGQFRIVEEQIILPGRYDAIDKRSAVNNAVKARVIVVRPKWTAWQVQFTLAIRNDTITKEQITLLLEIAGNNVGIGSYRPTASGEFGCFEVVKLEKIEMAVKAAA